MEEVNICEPYVAVEMTAVVAAAVLYHRSFYNIPVQPYLLLLLSLLLLTTGEVTMMMMIFLVELDSLVLEMMVENAFIGRENRNKVFGKKG